MVKVSEDANGTQMATTNFVYSIDRWDPRLTYETHNIIFCCVSCNEKKKNSNPDDWRNFLRVGKALCVTPNVNMSVNLNY